jgi:hypothetical protein
MEGVQEDIHHQLHGVIEPILNEVADQRVRAHLKIHPRISIPQRVPATVRNPRQPGQLAKNQAFASQI